MISNIIDWAIARKFHEYCTLEKEFEKTEEETKEILEAIKKQRFRKDKRWYWRYLHNISNRILAYI